MPAGKLLAIWGCDVNKSTAVNVTGTVEQIGRINITGNVIPPKWWHHIKMPDGKPDSTAIILLSEIIYWYRPAEIRDEFTGELKGWRKRFKSDKLQRSYQSFADQFGFTKRQATDALKRLQSHGVIELELRTISTPSGLCNNVLFIQPVPGRVNEITNTIPLINNESENDSVSGTAITFERNRGSVKTEQVLHPDVTALTFKRETNTEITTEITTENKTPLIPQGKTQSQKLKFDPLSARPENISEPVWQDWVTFRKEIKKPLTETSCRQIAKKLAGHPDPDAVLCDSIANGWQGIFPERTTGRKPAKPSTHSGFSEKNYESRPAAWVNGGKHV